MVFPPFFLMIELQIPAQKNVYFASDFHLGFPNHTESVGRERQLVAWLENIQSNASHLFLMGDLFDFWFEYGKVVPAGFTRFIGKLASISDAGIQIHIFVGNHDLWMKDYFEKELNAKIYHEPQMLHLKFESTEKWFWIGHGDGLGPGDHGYKLLKKVFTNSLAKFLFNWLHPNIGMALAHFWSDTRKQKLIQQGDEPFNESTDYILAYVKEMQAMHQKANQPVEAYVFGHRHWPMAYSLDNNAVYFNLGDWFSPQFKHAYYLEVNEKTNHFQHIHA